VLNQAQQNYNTMQTAPMQQLAQVESLYTGAPQNVSQLNYTAAPSTVSQVAGLGAAGLAAAKLAAKKGGVVRNNKRRAGIDTLAVRKAMRSA
jgi:hypothetical protein